MAVRVSAHRFRIAAGIRLLLPRPRTAQEGFPIHFHLIIICMNLPQAIKEFSLQTYIEERWTDWRLNLSSYVGENAIKFPQILVQHLWVPDLVFDNAKSGVLFDVSVPNTYVVVCEDGSLGRTSRYNLVISCQMNFLILSNGHAILFYKIGTLIKSR
ncbi:hypothetical protein JTE90_004240 [Oedothorax gibbosus]|uniref:Neurotransmitter-gated ion-channel ligand-binding domain-containing protein n=1 Tax=Oedothorax gibbosus TaxID=931172 RepID=A0AAV6TMR2_9ARAC|nr:hypothetical protein JTE90_004240 [Oedothorax gibbosus]